MARKLREHIPFRLRHRMRKTASLATSVAGATARRVVLSRTDADRALGEALVGHLDEMKGMAMKVGQILSYMDGTLPEETQAILRKLQQGAEPLAYEAIAEVVEGNLKAPVNELFEEFSREPIAAASIGQVHRATFDSRKVAVKVQYPHVRETFEADMTNLHRIASLATVASSVDGHAIVEELRSRIVEECDYLHEARWQEKFRIAFSDDEEVAIPQVVPKRTTEQVLTTQWHEGQTFYQFTESSSRDRQQHAARVLTRFALRSMFTFGTIQADPHPGNYLFPATDQVVFLDFGCVRVFTSDFIVPQTHLARVVIEDRRDDFPEAVLATGMVARPRNFDYDQWWDMMQWQYRPYCTPNFHFTKDYMREGQKYSGPSSRNMYRVAIPPQWIWMARLLVGLHSVLVRLDARGNFRSILQSALNAPHSPLLEE